jgi:hypothetical protein
MSAHDGTVEEHPSFGWAVVGRVSTTGTHLFDSEIQHQHYVMLRIGRATRKRELNRDWIHGEHGPNIVEVAMSMAQWGALVSSFGSSGVPVTIERINGERIEEAPHEPRLALSTSEVEGSVDRLLSDFTDKLAAVADAFDRKAGRRELGDLLRDLQIALKNARPNARYAAKTFTEHVENVVTKARADIEAVVQMAAERQGLDAGDLPAALQLGSSSEAVEPGEGADDDR